MRLSTAVKIIALAHTYCCYVPSVLCKKESMRDATTSTTVTDNERVLSSSSSSSNNDYPYHRNYVAVIESKNLVTLLPNGGTIAESVSGNAGNGHGAMRNLGNAVPGGTMPQLQGSTTILNGKVFDPADIAIVNKPNGVELNDIPSGLKALAQMFLGLPFAGGRQPKQPIPPGDSAFVYHGECVATSVINGGLLDRDDMATYFCRKLQGGESLDSSTVTSHSCKLNICLGAGGFNCIAIYSGTSFVFDVGQQFFSGYGCGGPPSEPSLPPPFPSTIIGGTGSFEGIEGTVDIATICGTTGPILVNSAGDGGAALAGIDRVPGGVTLTPAFAPMGPAQKFAPPGPEGGGVTLLDEALKFLGPAGAFGSGPFAPSGPVEPDNRRKVGTDVGDNIKLGLIVFAPSGPVEPDNRRKVGTDVGDNIKLGLIVQTISIHANMPLPVAP